jgi:AraC-like DNA-binding protein
MEKREAQIQQLLETFFNATQIEALYFDQQMTITSCHFQDDTVEQFLRLSMGRIERFLTDIFEQKGAAPKSFYTYYLDQNLVCNISVLYDNGTCCGAAVTQPVSLNPFKKADIEAAMSNMIHGSTERDTYIAVMGGAPVLSYARIRSMGEVLGALSHSALEEAAFHQVFCGGQADPAVYQFLQSGSASMRREQSPFSTQHNGYLLYRRVKDAISKGDADALQEMFHTLNPGSIHLDQQTSKDTVRSLKNGFIEGFAMCCFIAVEAGVPYSKARNLTEGFITELESTENIADMYTLSKSALLAFARAVAITHIMGHSRPVQLTMEYIETHYAEKITLKTLAEHVNLSEYYLSTLVKKETGSNIVDIINRVRIEESKNILRKSAVSISELATMVGYSYSNHFSRVFKQHTGMTPSGYVKMSAAASDEETAAKEMMNMLSDQLHHCMLMFPGIFDVIRIVDPFASVAWKVRQTQETIGDTCYAFWNRKQFCETCISRMALEHDKPFVKLDQKKDHPFLVFAVPIAVGGKKYVIELLKGVSDNYFDCTKEPVSLA